MTRKTIRNQGSQENLDCNCCRIKTEANVAKKASALVAATDHGGIQTRQTIGCGIKRGKLYYLDLQSKDSNKLQQALMADGSEGEKKKMTWLCLMKTKDKVNLLFQNFHKMIETQYNAKTTCSNTPHQNGVAERKNRHLLEVVRASLIAAKTPISYWEEAITSAAYLINRVPSSAINFQTPLQALTNVVVAPTVPNLPPRVFGCVAFVHLHKHQRTKLTSHALQYSMYFSSESELQGEYHKEIQTLDYDYHISEEDESGQSELVNQKVGELDMSGQQFRFEDVFIEIPNQSSFVEGVLNLEPDPFMKRLPHRHNRGIPKPTYEPELSTKEALADPRWKATMNEEMKSLQKNETWELVESILVAKGYTQTYGIDYTETFAPVAKINTIRVLLSLTANLDWSLQQFDVKNVFLHSELSEEIYMDLPPGCMCQKSNVRRCANEEVIVWVKAIPKSMVWKWSQYMHNPGKQHMNAVMCILRYLKNAPRKGILFAKNVDHQSIEVYTDADWAGAVDDRRSTSGYFTFVGGNLVTWKSKKQNVVARSSAEAEFRGMTLGLVRHYG
ncbi:Retrovirus-related Pol polyprotein from transposon TNT 1-94 [Vitis vinifera]|uniref:Retrovirus-related Pol polyprotein from transposon TNT 1-94 n=1 Tax=Vitis vinifera TaxID=29760 RepID=A0A438F0M0_VITVI|nr:Retrovirus-related Pol polyprotein from transposon TNT 1-94 [Vitis vinifera]